MFRYFNLLRLSPENNLKLKEILGVEAIWLRSAGALRFEIAPLHCNFNVIEGAPPDPLRYPDGGDTLRGVLRGTLRALLN